jgi:uncharacterized protein involved in outer membrane biogenesis
MADNARGAEFARSADKSLMPRRPYFLRRLLRWMLWAFIALLLLVAAVFLYVTFVGVRVDASFLRGTLAQTFSDNLARKVRFEGPIEMEISATPRLRVGGLHIANPQGFGNEDFASLGEARLALDLWPLLFRKRLNIEELAGADVLIHLQRRADGSNNWTFQRQAQPAPRQQPRSGMRADQAIALLDIQDISLEKLHMRYTGPGGKPHFFSLHALKARSPAGEPFRMTLNGTVETQFPYRMDFTGGKLADLATDKPWPIEFTLRFLSSTLTAKGNLNGTQGEVTFGLGTENLLEFERLLQTRLPNVGASGIAATVVFAPHHVALTQLAGVMGNTTLVGAVDFDDTGRKPKISGSLVLPTLDLGPFLGDEPGSQSAQPPASFAEVYRRLAAATFDLKKMNSADLDLTLGVVRWENLPGDFNDATVHLRLEDGQLKAPVKATLAGVALSGSIDADAGADPPRFRLALGTRDSDLGGLAELLTGVRGVKGQLGRFDLRLVAHGDQGSELVRSLDVELDVERGRFSYGNIEGERPVRFTLHKLAVRLPPGKALQADMRGDLLGHAFVGRLRSGALEPILLQARAPLDFALRSGDVRARITGTLEPPSAERGPQIAFDFSAPRAGELASWFGFRPDATAPALLTGKASLQTAQWRLYDVLFQLGRSTLTAELTRSITQAGKPLVKVRLGAHQIDVPELERLIPARTQDAEPGRPVLDIPILPQRIDLTDADIDVRVKRFAGTALEVRDLAFDGRVREGYMHPSPFAVSVADTGLNGAVTMDLRGAEPTVGLWLYAPGIDVGRLLQILGVTRGLEATFSDFAVNLTARSSRLGDMLKRSELLGSIGGGRIVLRDPNTRAEAHITLDKGELLAAPGAPLKLTLKGELDRVPIALGLDTASAYQLADAKSPVPFKLDMQAADSDLTLSGSIARPIGSELLLALEAHGGRFDHLNKLARASLPPWGPWTAAGKFRMSPSGYDVTDLRLQIGASVLNGQGRLDTASGRPRLAVALAAPVIQLDDFKLGDWSPVERKSDDSAAALTADEIRNRAASASDRTQKLLSAQMLRRQDASLTVDVQQVLSGKDKLGAGSLQARLADGRADIGPLAVELAGGSAKVWLGYEPSEQDVQVDMHVDVHKFDYGVLARRIKPESDLHGSFSLKMDVASRARYLSEILRHGSGRIDFAIWPQNMRAGVFDMWAVNVLVALVPAVDPGKASKVNCAIGRFDLNDGQLVGRSIILDTGRMRVNGTGAANFASETFDLRMQPQAKTAQFLSLATPIEVSGGFNEFKIGVSAGDILGTAARLATSIFWVPLQKLFGKKLPADGADVCNPSFSDAGPAPPAR